VVRAFKAKKIINAHTQKNTKRNIVAETHKKINEMKESIIFVIK